MRTSAATPPTSLSPSRAGDFMQCPLLYRFRVIDKLPEKPTAAATRGTVVHAVLERLFDAPAGERSAPRARSLVTGRVGAAAGQASRAGGAVRRGHAGRGPSGTAG